ncbi:VanZ family protein [Priestia koreensis]|nr:VanZ family protein [Priestia koreensis]
MMKKVLLLLMMIAIFYFSQTPGLLVLDPSTWVHSGEFRDGVDIASILKPGGTFYLPYHPGIDAEFVTRKIAHFSFFGLLSLLFLWNLKGRLRYVLAWLFTALYAFTDEIHQAFTVGRDGRILDVMVDSAGALLFLLIATSIRYIRRT